jgi:hypothetical protein
MTKIQILKLVKEYLQTEQELRSQMLIASVQVLTLNRRDYLYSKLTELIEEDLYDE